VDERPPHRQHAVRNVLRVTAGLVAATVTLRQLIIVATHAIRARRVVVGRRSL